MSLGVQHHHVGGQVGGLRERLSAVSSLQLGQRSRRSEVITLAVGSAPEGLTSQHGCRGSGPRPGSLQDTLH